MSDENLISIMSAGLVLNNPPIQVPAESYLQFSLIYDSFRDYVVELIYQPSAPALELVFEFADQQDIVFHTENRFVGPSTSGRSIIFIDKTLPSIVGLQPATIVVKFRPNQALVQPGDIWSSPDSARLGNVNW